MQPLPTGNYMQKEEFYRLLKTPAGMNDESLAGLQKMTEGYPQFQAAWFLYLKNMKKSGHAAYENVLTKAAISVPDRKQLHHYLNPEFSSPENYLNQPGFESPDYELETEDNISKGESLIDKFLSANPGPIRFENKTLDESSNIGEYERFEDSSDVDDEMITETLALIFFEQKKYNKALDAFRKLSLKYPEKSVYFASRIEEIEKLKNI